MPRITVAIRFRPDENEKKIENLSCQPETGLINLSVNGTKQEFNFDKLLTESSSQEDVFRTCAIPIIDEVIEGYNGCIFAYGQTGAGKTHTMSGPTDIDSKYEDRGLCMRVAGYLFDCARKLTSDTIALRLSVLEIYNESLTDLLVEPVTAVGFGFGNGPSTPSVVNSNNPNSAAMLHSKLTIVDTSNGVIIPGLHILPISSYNDAYNILLEAQGNRAVAEHQLNRKSSRSHVIYTYYITRTKIPTPTPRGLSNNQLNNNNASFRSTISADDPEVVQSKLHLVDLAGSERMNKTGSTGSVQKEANHINKSLSYLEQVVIALTQNKRDHIPYRQSKLTYLLKDSLGGNCNTYMIACIWPHHKHSWETLSTLRFAARMKCIETHPVRNSLVSKDGQNLGGAVNVKLVQQIEALKRELVMRDFVHANLMSAQLQQQQRQQQQQQQQARSPSKQSHNQTGSLTTASTTELTTATTVASIESYMPDLTKAQKIKTYKQCVGLFKASSTSTTLSNNDELSLIENSMELQSLSHAHLLIGTLKAALIDIGAKYKIDIATEVANTILARNSGYTDKLQCLYSVDSMSTSDNNSVGGDVSKRRTNSTAPVTADEGGNDDSQRVDTIEPSTPTSKATNNPRTSKNSTGSNIKSKQHQQHPAQQQQSRTPSKSAGGGFFNGQQMAPINEGTTEFDRTSGKNTQNTHSEQNENTAAGGTESASNDQQKHTPEETAAAFELYKLNQGAKQNASYEETKEALKSSKARQVEIITYLNNQKQIIDSLTGKLTDISVSEEDTIDEQRETTKIELQGELETAKKSYRSAHNELRLCKEQIAETQSLKKRAMTSLLTNFHAFYDDDA